MSFDTRIQVYIIFLAGRTLSKCAQLRGSRLDHQVDILSGPRRAVVGAGK